MPSTSFIDRDKVVMKLIKYRCKLAKKQADKDQKNEFISRESLKKMERIQMGKMNFMGCSPHVNNGVE